MRKKSQRFVRYEMLVMMAAMDACGCIGSDQGLPWHIPEELAFFRERTLHQHLLMGRITYEHLPCKLTKRYVHVLTRQDIQLNDTSIILEHSMQDVLDRWQDSDDMLIICGGSMIYEAFLPYAKELWLSRIPGEYEGNRYFPRFSGIDFQCTETSVYTAFSWERYQRI